MEQPNMNQIEYLVKAITPQYPLSYEDVMHVISTYCQKCSSLGVSYSRDEIDRRLQNYCRGGY